MRTFARATATTLAVIAFAALGVLLAGCGAGQLSDRLADRVLVDADTPAERAARLDFVGLALCRVIADGVDGQDVTADQAAGDCLALHRAAGRTYAAAEGRWFETAMRGAVVEVIAVARGAVKRRGSVLGALTGGDLLASVPVAADVLGRGSTARAMLLDYRTMATELPPAELRAAIAERWTALGVPAAP